MSPKKKESLNSDFYYGEKAKFYGNSNWMAKNQINTSHRVFDLLEEKEIGGKIKEKKENLIILDLGCGTGYSALIFEEAGYNLIGIDLSYDMLMENQTQQKQIRKSTGIENLSRILINGSIEKIPIRNNSCNHIISISAFNFVLKESNNKITKEKILFEIINSLNEILKVNGRIVIEFYPKKLELDLYLRIFKKYSFIGGLIIDNPGLRKEQKFLILKSEK